MVEELTDRERTLLNENEIKHILLNQEAMKDQMGKNHEEVMERIADIKCPSPRCEAHDTRLKDNEKRLDKLELIIASALTVVGIVLAGFVYWVFTKLE